ncbi:MAG TPA: COX15/CtaA family protein [Pseudolabrys sp.]|jgi:cytochrome c oxidase assembly protein subunit 15|nr:COX15/CtaA family protein [Pseudolabrys sp.]
MDVSDTHARTIRLWLLTVAVMIFATLVVGGATRLTESGLSITQWKPITGVVPPLSQAAWEQDFKKYQQIPQYQELNRGMTLAQYKVIYWYEWTHRMLARAIGFVFLLPFLFFLWRGWAPKRLRIRLWALFGLLALQGAVGWWMVSSGLAGSDRVVVSQYRLAFHLTLACVLYLAVLWTAQQLAPARPVEAGGRLRGFALAILALVLAQIYLGALVAGTGAGHAYNTWPLIDGAFVPSAGQLFFLSPVWRNFFENILTVQFDHRMLAYVIWLAILFHAFDAWRTQRGATGALLLAGVATIQVALGITTLLMAAPIDLALAHQVVAIVVFTVAAVHAERLWHREAAAVPTAAMRGHVTLELAE